MNQPRTNKGVFFRQLKTKRRLIELWTLINQPRAQSHPSRCCQRTIWALYHIIIKIIIKCQVFSASGLTFAISSFIKQSIIFKNSWTSSVSSKWVHFFPQGCSGLKTNFWQARCLLMQQVTKWHFLRRQHLHDTTVLLYFLLVLWLCYVRKESSPWMSLPSNSFQIKIGETNSCQEQSSIENWDTYKVTCGQVLSFKLLQEWF